VLWVVTLVADRLVQLSYERMAKERYFVLVSNTAPHQQVRPRPWSKHSAPAVILLFAHQQDCLLINFVSCVLACVCNAEQGIPARLYSVPGQPLGSTAAEIATMFPKVGFNRLAPPLPIGVGVHVPFARV
jgi:hypothetical protein